MRIPAIDETDTKYFQLTTNTSVITDANVRFNDCYFDPITRLVHIEYEVYSAGKKVPGKNVTVANVPAGYRPSATVQRAALVQVTLADQRTEDCYIDTAGDIKMNNFVVGQDVQLFTLFITYKI